MKKTVSFILALVMMLCMASTAFAADGTTNITLTKAAPEPITYTLTVPASLDFENPRTDHNGVKYIYLEDGKGCPKITLDNPSLISNYKIEYAGFVYNTTLTATCNGLTNGNTTITKSGLDYDCKKTYTRQMSFASGGQTIGTDFVYSIANEALENMDPGTYTDTITWTVNFEKAS